MTTYGTVRQSGSLLNDPLGNYRFVVTFYPQQYSANSKASWKPSGTMGFTSVSGFSYSVNTQAIREGGYNTTLHQVPMSVDFSALQLDRGVILGTPQNWEWMKMLLRVVQGRAHKQKVLFRSDVEIAVLTTPVPYSTSDYGIRDDLAMESPPDKVGLRFRLFNAWPSSVVYSDLNAGDNALMVERMTLVHEGMAVSWADVDGNRLVSAPNFNNP